LEPLKSTFRFLVVLSALAVMLAGPSVSMAADDPTDAYSLGEVVVRTDGEGVAESAGTVTTVDAAEIRMRGARTLDEALALIPGLFIRTGGDGTPRIDMRGFRTRHVLLLLDGTPFNAAYDGQFDPSFIPVEDIAEIRVTTGGSSVLYGQGGNGGVINIITKKGRQGMHAYMGAEGGEGDYYLGKAAISAGTGPLDIFASGSRYSIRGYRLSDDFTATSSEDGGLRDNSDRLRTNFFANLGINLSENTTAGFTVSTLKGDFGKPPITNPGDPFAGNQKFDRMDDMSGTTMQLAAKHDFDGTFSIRGWAYYNKLDTLENRYDDATYSTQGPGTFSEASTTEISGVNLQGSADMGVYGRATLALMFENDGWASTGFSINNKGKFTDIDLEKGFQVYSVAAQYEVKPLKGSGLVAGYGHHFQERQDAPGDDDFSYMVGAYYDLFEGTRLRASHERKVRFPSLSQLYGTDGGNTALKAERSMHYEAGVEQTLPMSSFLTLTGYYTDVKDFIEKDDSVDPKIYRNFQKYIFEGVEVTAENRAVENLLLRAAYSYMYTRDLSPGDARGELQYRPRHKLTVDGDYRFGFGLTAYASVAFVATQSFYNDTGERKELNDYALVDAKLSQDVLGDRVNLYVGVRNLLDRDYEQSYGLPQAGRTVYGGVEVKL
jgi:outer membrane cobalamin receptor